MSVAKRFSQSAVWCRRTFTAGVCGPEGSNSIRICTPTGSEDPAPRNNKDCITVNFTE